MPVEKVNLDPDKNEVSAIYYSDTTKALDEMYGLDGSKLTEEQRKRLMSMGLGLGETYSEITVPLFTHAAGLLGRFCGFKKNEAKGFVDAAIEEGWLQEYDHEGDKVVELTRKYGEMFSVSGRVLRTPKPDAV